jgi:hypothetical protein
LPLRSAIFAAVACLAFAWSHAGFLTQLEAADDRPAADKAAKAKAATEKAEKPAVAAEKKLDAKIIQRRLRARTDLTVEKLPLEQVVKKLADFHEIPIRLDQEGLKKAKIAVDAPVTVKLENYTLSAALNHILKEFGLYFRITEGAIVITNTPPEPEEPVAAPAPAEIAVPIAVEAVQVNDAEQMQANRQYQAVLRAELHFAKRVCQATPEQMRALRDELDKRDKTVKDKPQPNAGAQKLMIQRRVRMVPGMAGDPLQMARDRLSKAVKTCLSEEQAARFQEELDRRTADRRLAAVHNLVARLDREMILSATQREQITESLLAHWNDAWYSSLQMFVYNDQFFPNIPDAHVVKFLNATQKKIWPTIPKNQGAMFNNGLMGGIFGEEVFWSDDEPEAAPANGDIKTDESNVQR